MVVLTTEDEFRVVLRDVWKALNSCDEWLYYEGEERPWACLYYKTPEDNDNGRLVS